MMRLSVLAATAVAAISVSMLSAPSGGQDLLLQDAPGARPVRASDGNSDVIAYITVAEGHADSDLNELRRRDQAYERSTRRLLEEFRGAKSEEDRAPIRQKVEMVIEEHFDVRQQIRVKELEALEARLQRLRDLHEKREQAKSEIVERRIEQLVRDAEGLGWSSGGDSRGERALNTPLPAHAPHAPTPPPGGPVPPPAKPDVFLDLPLLDR